PVLDHENFDGECVTYNYPLPTMGVQIAEMVRRRLAQDDSAYHCPPTPIELTRRICHSDSND
ncbi:MAG: hypothetical protein PHS41_12645, partial [Victivallaceae bacterium]|nr:hypothetical protein [Victivallaceae bacterium]